MTCSPRWQLMAEFVADLSNSAWSSPASYATLDLIFGQSIKRTLVDCARLLVNYVWQHNGLCRSSPLDDRQIELR